MDADVIVVGAGISGLYTAVLLKNAGIRVKILEGRNRVSGRQWNYRNADIGNVDTGAAYIGSTQTKVLSVIKWLGLETYRVYIGDNGQKSSLTLKSGKQFYDSGIPSFKNPLILMDINNIIRKLDNLSKQVPIENPWDSPNADYWDSISVQEFFDNNMHTKEAKALAKIAVVTPFLVNPNQMSFLFLLHQIRLLGGLVSITTVVGGLQEYKVVGGSSQISERLADKLQGQIICNKHVVGINEIQDGVEVLAKCGEKYHAKKAVVCIPLPAISSIQFTPPLPNYLQQLSNIKPLCQCMKTFTFYDTAFWRDHGLSGELISEEGIVTYAVDDTKPDGSHPMIMGFVDGDKASQFASLSQEQRKRLITEQYASELGLEEFLSPTHYFEKYWQDDEEQIYSHGCCVWSLPPAHLSNIRKLPSPFAPFGNCYFSSTESALTFRGYMDGALRSANAVAAQVSKELGKPMQYDEYEFYEEIPYKPMMLIEQYLPSVPVFLAIVVVIWVCILLAVVIGIVLYIILK